MVNHSYSTEEATTTASPSRVSKDIGTPSKNDSVQRQLDGKLESRLNIKDLEALQDAFMAEGDGYDNRLNLNCDQFCEALALILNKGTKAEYAELFAKIDVAKVGTVDWDMFALHMLLEFYDRDDRVKSTQVPQWKDLKHLPSPHKEIIQRVAYLKNTNRYIGISKEGCVSMWGQNLKLQRSLKTGTDACKMRDLWVTYFVPLQNINKIALAFTSKEIAIYDLSTKLEFNCQYKIQGLDHTPLGLDYWSNPSNSNEAILVWGDTGGQVNALHFTSASIALFERPSAPAGEKQEPCLNVQLRDIIKRIYKNCRYTRHRIHTEWVRQVKYSANLECFISCATTWHNSLVIGWTEKHSTTAVNMKTTSFQIPQGVNAFDYTETLNLIATAGVNHHVCLWNPYVVSKPNGVLRGHMASVIQVQFNKARGQLISFSKDKVLRIWDVQLQVCIQRLAGMFPKGPEVQSALFFDEARNKLFITFNYQLTVIEMKPEIKDRVMSHDKPVVAAVYNSTYNQVVSVCQSGTVVVWMIDTGQKMKGFSNAHGYAEVTTLSQDPTETRLYTGSTDGTIKIWDLNGHCYHTLQVTDNGQSADVGNILVLKRSVLAVGWAKYISVFKSQHFKEYHVHPSDWKGGQEHGDDIMALAFSGPNNLATGSYDGEIIIWNNNSEQASKRLSERCRKQLSKNKTSLVSRETTMGVISENATGDPRSVLSGDQSRGTLQSKSRTGSRISGTSNEDTNEFSYSISKLLFMEARNKNLDAANLVSCGGSGYVRFWNSLRSALMGEFVAHQQVGNITMAIDEEAHWMATGDTDGVIKVWDIHDYCIKEMDELWTRAPRLQQQFVAHSDSITSLTLCQRNDRPLVLTSSVDCSVALWDIYGNQIGVFGQEEHWKIEPFVPGEEEEEEESPEEAQTEVLEIEPEEQSQWEPDTRAIEEPGTFRINIWDNTELGTDYRELRVRKRERRQPQTIPDLPYLHWEKTGQPPAGPYAALDTFNLQQVDGLQKPEFMSNPHKYFTERAGSGHGTNLRLPALAESLKAAFDEKTLFPRYILDFEAKMKNYHQQTLKDTTRKAGLGMLKATGTFTGNVTISQRSMSPKRGGLRIPTLPSTMKLKPIRAGSVKDSD